MEPDIVFLVSDRTDWVDGAIEVCRDLAVAPECLTWDDSGSVGDLGCALVADVVTEAGERTAAIELWAARAWQPLCVLSLIPTLGAGSLYQRFQRLGYRRIVPVNGLPSYWQCIRGNVRAVLNGPSRLIPMIAEWYYCYEPKILSTLTVAADLADEVRTVQGLSRALGFERPTELRKLFAHSGCPPPKEVLERLRLALAVEYARTRDPRPTRDEVAQRFKYSSGVYLGRHSRRLTGLSFGSLVEFGPSAALRRQPRGSV